MITIKGEKKEHREKRAANVHFSEVYTGSFERSFQLPEGVEADQVEARFENGVLEVSIPEAKAVETSRKVPINVLAAAKTETSAKKSA